MSKQNQPKYIYFVLASSSNSHYGFSTYQDSSGNVKSISYRKDKKGNPEPYQFSWSKNNFHRTLRFAADAVDSQGNSIVEFLRNHPECKGSPNGIYIKDEQGNDIQVNVFFKEMDTESDAQKAIDAKTKRLKAENLAANVSDEEVLDLAIMLGSFETKPLMARHYVMEIAGNKPLIFLEAYDNPQRKSLALIKKGIAKGILTVNGTVVVWNKTVLGEDENGAAAYIAKEKKAYDALENAVKASI
jgi:hypothetical protein